MPLYSPRPIINNNKVTTVDSIDRTLHEVGITLRSDRLQAFLDLEAESKDSDYSSSYSSSIYTPFSKNPVKKVDLSQKEIHYPNVEVKKEMNYPKVEIKNEVKKEMKYPKVEVKNEVKKEMKYPKVEVKNEVKKEMNYPKVEVKKEVYYGKVDHKQETRREEPPIRFIRPGPTFKVKPIEIPPPPIIKSIDASFYKDKLIEREIKDEVYSIPLNGYEESNDGSIYSEPTSFGQHNNDNSFPHPVSYTNSVRSSFESLNSVGTFKDEKDLSTNCVEAFKGEKDTSPNTGETFRGEKEFAKVVDNEDRNSFKVTDDDESISLTFPKNKKEIERSDESISLTFPKTNKEINPKDEEIIYPAKFVLTKSLSASSISSDDSIADNKPIHSIKQIDEIGPKEGIIHSGKHNIATEMSKQIPPPPPPISKKNKAVNGCEKVAQMNSDLKINLLEEIKKVGGNFGTLKKVPKPEKKMGVELGHLVERINFDTISNASFDSNDESSITNFTINNNRPKFAPPPPPPMIHHKKDNHPNDKGPADLFAAIRNFQPTKLKKSEVKCVEKEPRMENKKSSLQSKLPPPPHNNDLISAIQNFGGRDRLKKVS
uniref:WH2 domain-containing protein n=1 Tax=Rhabditophanes sp. KR3021 TaxID=114890 RepID=A0AC35U024_9BILA